VPGHQGRGTAKGKGPQYEVRDCGYETPCWVWLWHTTASGYGWFQNRLAHGVFWERENGPVPSGRQLDHLCRNRACIRVDHMEIVTNAENQRRGLNAKLTEANVREIKRRLAMRETQHALAAEFGVSQGLIGHIATGRAWADVTAA
jgi:hypothetical protein